MPSGGRSTATPAAEQLVTSHLRLVARIAMGYRGYGLPIGEVISKATSASCRPSTVRPRQGVPPRHLRHVVDPGLDPGVHPALVEPREDGHHGRAKKLFFNLRRAKSQLQALEEGDLKPDQVKTIARRLGVSEEDVVSMNRRLGGDASLNAPVRATPKPASGRTGSSTTPPTRRRSWCSRRKLDRLDLPVERAHHAERPRAAHLRGAAALGEPGHARGPFERVRRLSRAHPPDRGARLREGAEGGAEGRAHRGATA